MNKQTLMCKLAPIITQNTWRRIDASHAAYGKFACITDYKKEYSLAVVFSTGAPASDYTIRLSLWDNDMANRIGLVDISREDFEQSPVRHHISCLYYSVSAADFGKSFEVSLYK